MVCLLVQAIRNSFFRHSQTHSAFLTGTRACKQVSKIRSVPKPILALHTLSSQPGTAEFDLLLSSFSTAAPYSTKRIVQDLKSNKIDTSRAGLRVPRGTPRRMFQTRPINSPMGANFMTRAQKLGVIEPLRKTTFSPLIADAIQRCSSSSVLVSMSLLLNWSLREERHQAFGSCFNPSIGILSEYALAEKASSDRCRPDLPCCYRYYVQRVRPNTQEM